METINYQNFRIEAENICVDYNGKVALYDANLRLQPGQICGLVGMNGAGKTTFFNALTGFVNISKGKIRINGESVRSAQKDQTIAYVPQHEGIDSQFPISVWDVVMMGRYGSMNIFRSPRESDVQAVKDAIERVDLTDSPFILIFPFDIFTKPVKALKKVVLPAPFIPTNPQIWPGFNLKLASYKATLPL